MTNLKSKLIILAIIFMLGLVAMQTSIFASNENIQMLEKNTGDYIIYVKDNLNIDFKFAFSNDINANKENLNYYDAETDSNGNKIAFVNSETISLFSAPTYMWVKTEADYVLEGIEIDLSKAINENDLQIAANLTKTIKVDTTQTNTTEETVDGKKVTTTVGKVVLTNQSETSNYSYILIKDSNSDEYNKLTNLATRISKFNSETDMYTQIQVYSEFFNKSKELAPDNAAEWIKVENNEILQPEDSEDGEKYILWIKEENSTTEKIDIQFLTSHKEYSEEKIVETITTKLPVTYDNNTLLIVLAILVIAIIFVCIRIKMLSKKEK